MTGHLFLSYATDDQKRAELVCARLEAEGFHCWLAGRDIPPGATWPEEIARAIHGAEAVVVILTEHANQSRHIAREIELADKLGLRLYPVCFGQIEPGSGLEYHLSACQRFDAGPDGTELDGLVEALGRRDLTRETVPITPPAPKPAIPRRLLVLGALGIVVAIVIVFFFQQPGRRVPPDIEPRPSVPGNQIRPMNPGPPEGGPGSIQGNERPAAPERMEVRCTAVPHAIGPGGQTELRVLVLSERNLPVPGATVRIDSGGGWFVQTGAATVVGQTDERGVFGGEWRAPQPAAGGGYQMSVLVMKEGSIESRGECFVPIQ